MPGMIDLTGQRFGKLMVVHRCAERHKGHIQFDAVCDCGKKIRVIGRRLREGDVTDCGCQKVTADTGMEAGMRFSRLVTVAPQRANYRACWNCICDCGNHVLVSSLNLRTKKVESCGCRRRELWALISTRQVITHAMTGTRTYRSWQAMRIRCLNPNAHDYPRYGGRGIQVCARWVDSFEAFFADMGERPEGMTLDRWPDVNGNYEPGNCRWATVHQQARNTRTNRYFTINGKTQCLRDWCDELKIATSTFYMRLKAGWDEERALTTPPDMRFYSKEKRCAATM